MKTPQKLKLIDGTFSPKDAKEILMNVFTSKMQFHQHKNFSSQERYGKQDENAVKRIPELLKCKEMITALIEQGEKKKEAIVISAEVTISFSKSTE